jgi:hypothetical protein
MKKLFAIALLVFASVQLFAQLQINPQFGINFLTVKNPPEGVKYDGKVGVSMGVDLRFGSRFQFQPGVHWVHSVNSYQTTIGPAATGDVVYNSMKLKALAAFNLIDAGGLKLRVNFGPAYDFLLSAKEKESKNDLKSDYTSGTFFLQGGVGVDFLFLTADVGYASGLSKTFAGETAPDSKMAGMYASIGVIFGKGK